jgi:hypothetical protein
MAGEKGIHEGFEIRPPPLCQGVANFPIGVWISGRVLRSEALVQACFETADFVGRGGKVITWSVKGKGNCQWKARVAEIVQKRSQLEERICDLQHQNVRMIVLVADQDALARASHSMLLVVFFQSFQPGNDGGVFFWLCLFGAKRVV